MLSKREYQLLTLLSTRERSGRDVAAAFERETGERISYGTLYTTLRRLVESGFSTARDSADGDGRVRYFKITGSGQRAVATQRREFSELASFGYLPGRTS